MEVFIVVPLAKHIDALESLVHGSVGSLRYAKDLEQLPSEGVTISPKPKDWVCKETGATENLWLNLSTGHIGSGRQVSSWSCQGVSCCFPGDQHLVFSQGVSSWYCWPIGITSGCLLAGCLLAEHAPCAPACSH
jgi:hypothetical protein